MGCPDESLLDALVRGDLPEPARAGVLAHLDGCAACASVVAELARLRTSPAGPSIAFGQTAPVSPPAAPSGPPPPLPASAAIGRYRLLRRLGAGGMGTVFEAYDPELDRRVAIKVLHPDPYGDLPTVRALLVREAQAMARLAHPNVVTVFDVGAEGHQLFLSMELVPGTTLDKWLDVKRSREAVLGAFVQAGRGLAAAHAAGLVHRDFKPQNVLVGEDGRVRVTDFGLARAPTRAGGTGGMLQTQAGALVGTPAYMSPEQWMGRIADPRSDQWSFGVALFEALVGSAPFAGRTLDELRTSVVAGARAPIPSDLPRDVRTALDRALRTASDQRYPSMDELLVDLDRPRAPLWKRIAPYAAVGLGASALGAAVLVAWPRGGRAKPPSACSRVADKLDETWSVQRRLQLAAKIKGGDPAFDALDRYAEAWRAKRVEACESAVRKETSEELRDLVNACLDQRLTALGGVVRALEKAPGDPLAAALALPPVADCSDQERVKSGIYLPKDPAIRDEVQAIADTLADAAALLDAGRAVEAEPLVDSALTRAKTLGWEPILAEAQYRKAAVLDRRHDARGAERAYKEAFATARIARHDEVLRAAAIALVSVVGADLHRPADAEEWIQAARAEVKRAPDDVVGKARLYDHEAAVDIEAGRHEDARKKLVLAIETRENAWGTNHADVGTARYNLGGTLLTLGDFERGLAERKKALAIMTGVYGEDHPRTAEFRVGVGKAHFRKGELDDALLAYRTSLAVYDRWQATEHLAAEAHEASSKVFAQQKKWPDAIRELEQAVALLEKSLGPAHLEVADLVEKLADLMEEAGRAADALPKVERSLAAFTKKYGAEAPELAGLLERKGSLLSHLGRYAEAVPPYETAIANLGADHPDVGRVFYNLALLKKKKGDKEGAKEAYEASLTALELVLPADDPKVTRALMGNGWFLMEDLGRPADAIPFFERAVTGRAKRHGATARDTKLAEVALAEAKKRAGKR